MIVQQRETMTAPQAADKHAVGDSFVAALAQIAPRLGNVTANLERHREVIAEASAAGADLVVFPELSLTGYFLKDLVPDVALRIDSEEIQTLAAACGTVDAPGGSSPSQTCISRPTTRAFTTLRCI
jgi:hypothetical protein